MKEILERLEQKMDSGLERLEQKIDANIGRLEQKIDANIGRLEQKMDANIGRLEQKMDAGFARVDEQFAMVDDQFASVDGQLQKQGVLLEALTGDVKMALEGISGNREVLDMKFAEVLEKLDERIQPVELATRHIAAKSTKPR